MYEFPAVASIVDRCKVVEDTYARLFLAFLFILIIFSSIIFQTVIISLPSLLLSLLFGIIAISIYKKLTKKAVKNICTVIFTSGAIDVEGEEIASSFVSSIKYIMCFNCMRKNPKYDVDEAAFAVIYEINFTECSSRHTPVHFIDTLITLPKHRFTKGYEDPNLIKKIDRSHEFMCYLNTINR